MDWLLAPVSSVTRMVDEWSFLPTDEEAEHVPQVYWPRVNALYPHILDWQTDPARSEAIYARKADWLGRVAEKPRRVFIVSNTQNNLGDPRWLRALGDDWFRLDDGGLGALRSALEARFGSVELYAVTYADRHSIQDGADRVFELTPDSSGVEGDPTQWRSVLETVLG